MLDFDGIIVESVGIKTSAFRELFKSYPEHLERIIDFHLKNDGLSRYRKFDYIYANLLKKPLDESVSLQLGERFSELVLEEIKNCPFVPGAVQLLEIFSKRVPIYIASGTPEMELLDIVKARGIEQFFTGVRGTPATKAEIIRRVLATEKVDPEYCLFVGDTLTDYTESGKCGVRFVGRWDRKLPPRNPFTGLGVEMVSDLNELLNCLEPTGKSKGDKGYTWTAKL